MKPQSLSGVIVDIPPPHPELKYAVCRSPSDFLAHRRRFGNPVYAVNIFDDDSGMLDDVWFFENDLQDAVAIGMRWHERGCALEQYPEEENGEIFYGYRVKGLTHYEGLNDLLYEGWLWERIGADLNAAATSEIMTSLRKELFIQLARWSDEHIFMMLDFSRPGGETEFLENWANDVGE